MLDVVFGYRICKGKVAQWNTVVLYKDAQFTLLKVEISGTFVLAEIWSYFFFLCLGGTQ
jgi:hypothetical protein